MNLSEHATDVVRKKPIEGLKALGAYDIAVFYRGQYIRRE